MNTRSTWILLLLVLAGGLYIWFLEARLGSTEERRRRVQRALRFDPADVARVQIERDGMDIDCVKTNGEWRIVKPVEARAENAVVRRLISTLDSLGKNATVTRAERRGRGLTAQDYGLVPPQVVVRLEGDNFSRLINVGNLSPDGDSLFIAADNAQEDVLAVETNLLAAIPQDLGGLRSKTLFDYAIKNVRKIEIKTSEGFVSLALDSDRWMIRQPYVARADRRKVEQLLKGLLGLRISRFLRDDTTEKTIYGFDEVDSGISFSLAGAATPRELRFGLPLPSDNELIYAGFRDKRSVFALPASILSSLKQVKPEDIRDRNLFSLSAADIQRIKIAKGDQKIEMRRGSEGWGMVRPRSWQVDRSVAGELLATWTGSMVESFVPAVTNSLQEWGLTTNSTVFSISDTIPASGEDKPDVAEGWLDFKIGDLSTNRESVAVLRVGSEWISILPRRIKSIISLDPLTYKSRTVLKLDLDSIQSITLKRGDMVQTLVRNSEGMFQPDLGGQGLDARTMPQGSRLEALSLLRCEGYVASGDFEASQYGLEDPTCTLTLGLTAEEGISKSLLIGKPKDENTVYARIRGQDVVFLLDRKLAGIVCSDLYAIIETPQDED